MSELEKKKTGYLSTTSHTDPFEEYANAIVARGKFLKFVKGDFFAGKERPGQNPVIVLGASSYMHADRTIGRVYVPVLNKVVDWVPTDGNNAPNEPPDTTSPPDTPPGSSPSDTPTAAKSEPAKSEMTKTKSAAAKPAGATKSRF
jgi:hypothetical protein